MILSCTIVHVLLLHPAGIAGGIIGASAATNPTTVPVVYNPYAAVGSRYSEWADSKIPRLYHSVAFLLLDATVSAS